MNTSQPFISAIATIGIPVTNQDRALEFYTETLGMEKQLDVPLPQLGGRWITIAPPGGATAIALLRAHEGVPAGVTPGNVAAPSCRISSRSAARMNPASIAESSEAVKRSR